MNSTYIYCSKINKKALYFLEQSIFEKAKIHPSPLTLFSLLGVTDLGLGRPWPGSRLRVKEEFGTGWVSVEMMMWVPGGRNTGWVLEMSPFLFPSWIKGSPETYFYAVLGLLWDKFQDPSIIPSFFSPEFCQAVQEYPVKEEEEKTFWRWSCECGQLLTM